jgi:hypothetical protein
MPLERASPAPHSLFIFRVNSRLFAVALHLRKSAFICGWIVFSPPATAPSLLAAPLRTVYRVRRFLAQARAEKAELPAGK